jgi:hypothetical protein
MIRGAIVTVAMGLLLAGCGGESKDAEPAAPASPKSTKLQLAQQAGLPGIQQDLKMGRMDDEAKATEFLSLGDEGKSLTLANPPQGGSVSAVLTLPAMKCVLESTKAPDSVTSQLMQTTALMGRQEASWDTVALSYSYQPSDGISAVFTEK